MTVPYRQIENYLTVPLKKGEREGRTAEGGGRGQEGAQLPLGLGAKIEKSTLKPFVGSKLN